MEDFCYCSPTKATEQFLQVFKIAMRSLFETQLCLFEDKSLRTFWYGIALQALVGVFSDLFYTKKLFLTIIWKLSHKEALLEDTALLEKKTAIVEPIRKCHNLLAGGWLSESQNKKGTRLKQKTISASHHLLITFPIPEIEKYVFAENYTLC